MDDNERSLIWDLLIPDKELKKLAKMLCPRQNGSLDSDDILQEMRMHVWQKLNNTKYWVKAAKNHALNLLRHEKYERKNEHKNSVAFNPQGCFDEDLINLTKKRIYEENTD